MHSKAKATKPLSFQGFADPWGADQQHRHFTVAGDQLFDDPIIDERLTRNEQRLLQRFYRATVARKRRSITISYPEMMRGRRDRWGRWVFKPMYGPGCETIRTLINAVKGLETKGLLDTVPQLTKQGKQANIYNPRMANGCECAACGKRKGPASAPEVHVRAVAAGAATDAPPSPGVANPEAPPKATVHAMPQPGAEEIMTPATWGEMIYDFATARGNQVWKGTAYQVKGELRYAPIKRPTPAQCEEFKRCAGAASRSNAEAFFAVLAAKNQFVNSTKGPSITFNWFYGPLSEYFGTRIHWPSNQRTPRPQAVKPKPTREQREQERCSDPFPERQPFKGRDGAPSARDVLAGMEGWFDEQLKESPNEE